MERCTQPPCRGRPAPGARALKRNIRDEASSARIDAEKEIEKRIAALQDLYGPLLTGHDTLTKSLSDLDAQLAASTDPDDYDHALASESSRRDVDPACVTKT